MGKRTPPFLTLEDALRVMLIDCGMDEERCGTSWRNAGEAEAIRRVLHHLRPNSTQGEWPGRKRGWWSAAMGRRSHPSKEEEEEEDKEEDEDEEEEEEEAAEVEVEVGVEVEAVVVVVFVVVVVLG